MKTKTNINISDFIPENIEDYAWAGQISDYPKAPGQVARVLIVYSYNINHRTKQIILEAEIKHFDITIPESPIDVTHHYNYKVEDWIISNNYKVVLRDVNGMMLINPDFVPEENREHGEEYTENQKSQYIIQGAFNRFSTMIKSYGIPLHTLFEKIVEMDDNINNLFDYYKPLIPILNQPPKLINP